MIFVSFLLVMLTTQYHNVHGQSRIVGGIPVNNNSEYPFFAIPERLEYLCGASLIHGDILLSAAHCGDEAWVDGIWLGGTSIENNRSSSVYYSVNGTVSHESFNIPYEFDNDIMLIKLNQFITTVPLAQFNELSSVPKKESDVTAIGYGSTSEQDFTISPDLRMVNFKTVTSRTCRRSWGPTLSDTRMLCTGIPEGGKDTCYGDSGGPIFMAGTKTIVGIVSFGFGCARPATPSVNTRVSRYTRWIKKNTCALSSQPPMYC
jgi:secreted trypsin-like serine protease